MIVFYLYFISSSFPLLWHYLMKLTIDFFVHLTSPFFYGVHHKFIILCLTVWNIYKNQIIIYMLKVIYTNYILKVIEKFWLKKIHKNMILNCCLVWLGICVFLHDGSKFQPEGTFIEWKAEEILQVDGQNEQEWAVIGSSLSVGYKPDTGSGSDVPSK